MPELSKDYDRWRTRNAEDEENIAAEKHRRYEELADRADYERDRRKDEKCESRRQ
jgi:hypothetical protein